MAKAKAKAGAPQDDDLINVRNEELVIKLKKSTSKSKSLAWSYFGNLYFKKSDRIVESTKSKWVCNVCLIEALESRLFYE